MSLFISARVQCALIIASLALAITAEAADPYHAFTTEKAYVWSTPGYSWKDCRAVETSSNARPGSKDACDGRQSLLDPGDEVAIIRNSNGSLISEEHEIMFGDKLIKKKFYRVWMRDKKTGKEVRGWISEHQLTSPTPKKEDTTMKPDPLVTVDDPDCLPLKAERTNGAPEIQKEIKKIEKEIVRSPQIGLGRKIDHSQKELDPRKSDTEIDRFMCLYRSADLNEDDFGKLLENFKSAAKAAEKSFGVPYAMTMCFALTESSLRFETRGEYRGYGQFGSARVEDLARAIQKSPYSDMWTEYKNATSRSLKFSDSSIRSENNPQAAVGAIAFALRQMYGDLFPLGKCPDCSNSGAINPETASMNNLNRKDLYLMIGGYNFTPSKIGVMSKRSTAGLASSFPPPGESRDYMRNMDNCLSKGEEKHFRQASSEAANNRRLRDIRNLEKRKQLSPEEKSRMSRLKELVAGHVSQEYEDREAECSRTYPK